MENYVKKDGEKISVDAGTIRKLAIIVHAEHLVKEIIPEAFEIERRKVRYGTLFKYGNCTCMLCQISPLVGKMIVLSGFDKGNRYCDTQIPLGLDAAVLPSEFDDWEIIG